jgi:hypothetical protein
MSSAKKSDAPTLRAVLWATAMLLAAGILVRAGGWGEMPWDRSASADMIGASGDYIAMTTNGGVEELLFLIDGRNEMLMVYRVQNGRQVQLVERQDLRNLFTTARAAYLGTAPGQGRP